MTAGVLTPPCSKNVTLNHKVSLNCTAVASYMCWEIVGQNSSKFAHLHHNMLQLMQQNMSSNIHWQWLHHLVKIMLLLDVLQFHRLEWIIVTGHESLYKVIIGRIVAYLIHAALIVVNFACIGPLKKVSSLTVSIINSTAVLISWSPPFTLEGVPILGYNVTITNTTSGENETKLAKHHTLMYSIDHPDPGNNFTVTVVPINEVGAGQSRSTMVQFLKPGIFKMTIIVCILSCIMGLR